MKMFKAGIKLKGNYKLKAGNNFFELYDENGNRTYCEDSDGYWYKKEYDENGNELYYENSDGYWHKTEYDKNGNRTYFENSNGYWQKEEYDEDGNRIYYKDSSRFAIDSRPKKELTVEEIENNLGYKIKIIGGENNGK